MRRSPHTSPFHPLRPASNSLSAASSRARRRKLIGDRRLAFPLIMAMRVFQHALHLAREVNKLSPRIMKKHFCTDPAACAAYHMKRGVPGPYITYDFKFDHPMFGDAYGIHGVPIGKDKLPVWVDWSIVPGVLSPALDQDGLGICYLCAGTTAMGSVNFLKTGWYMVPSRQHFIDCSTLGSGDPLKGGNQLNVLEFTIQNGGILTESSYPFTGVKGPCKCNQSNMGPLVTIDSWQYVLPNCERSMKHAIAHQPLIVDVHLGKRILVDGNEMSLGNYEEGIISGPSDLKANHALVAIGYGEPRQGTQGWRAQNSHGPEWGQLGRCWIAKGTSQEGGAMGILRAPLVPLKWAIKDGPEVPEEEILQEAQQQGQEAQQDGW